MPYIANRTYDWSVATVTLEGTLTAESTHGLTHDEAAQLAEKSAPVTITVVLPKNGVRTVIANVYPLVYREPGSDDDLCWIFAAVGWAFGNVVAAESR